MTAPTTNTWPARVWNKHRHAGLALAGALLLTGCVHDTASFMVNGDKNHNLTLIRDQDLFWKKTVNISVVPVRMPECQGSLRVRDVPRTAVLELYWNQGDYPEPLFILKVENDYYAASTLSCRVQKFEQAPEAPGFRVGVFRETGGKLGFEPDAAGK